jgi:hypothetical protein
LSKKTNKEMNQREILSKIKVWQESQKGQTSAYEYEKTFDEMWQQLGKEIFQDSIGELPTDKNKKLC